MMERARLGVSFVSCLLVSGKGSRNSSAMTDGYDRERERETKINSGNEISGYLITARRKKSARSRGSDVIQTFKIYCCYK